MDRTKREENRLRRLAESYRTAQDNARRAMVDQARAMVESKAYTLTEVAAIAGVSKQAMWDQLYRTPK